MYYGDIMLGTNMTYTWLKKHCRLKCITLEGWGFKDSFIQSKFKGLSTKVYIVTSCSCRRKSQGYFEECRCLFMSPKKAFRSHLMIFKCKDLWCALQRWSCGLISKKTGNHLTPFVIHHCEKHWYCKLFWKELSTHKSINVPLFMVYTFPTSFPGFSPTYPYWARGVGKRTWEWGWDR